MNKPRVRFAPSPTGPLHIGGVRTALYTYLIARKHNGQFILRIEDTDKTRFVPGAEEYILNALSWCGLELDEGPGVGGAYGPYRQSERKEIYHEKVKYLLDQGQAYYAFDSTEELNEMRNKLAEQGIMAPKYDHSTRGQMRNSLTLSSEETISLLESGENVVVRLKVNPNEEVEVKDMIRGNVVFNSSELDDKILLKGDGMPTYHMANIVDDHLMGITHVIRGEEWLSSTAHHVLLYRAMGWEDNMPQFAHLPLILKPNGKGKLSKRDGAKFGFPVFPLSWTGEKEEDNFIGFREFGFDPDAVLNFLAFLGWNPGTEQEIFSLDELVEQFHIDQIVKSGARFDIDKAKWFNQQYIIAKANEDIVKYLQRFQPEIYGNIPEEFLVEFVRLMKPRVDLYTEFYTNGKYFFQEVAEYEEKMIRKKWSSDRKNYLEEVVEELFEGKKGAANRKANLEAYLEKNELKFGDVLPFLRLGISGTMKGPDLFEMLELFGKENVKERMTRAYEEFDRIKERI